MYRLVLCIAILLLSTSAHADFFRDIRNITAKGATSRIEADKQRVIREAERTAAQLNAEIARQRDDATALGATAERLANENRELKERAAQEVQQLKLEALRLDLAKSEVEQAREKLENRATALEAQKTNLEWREKVWSASAFGLVVTTLLGIFGSWLGFRSNSDQRSLVKLQIEKAKLEVDALVAKKSAPADTEK